MEHLHKKIYLAVAQLPFEVDGNTFATLVPLLTTTGEVLDKDDFRRFGLVFWLVRHQLVKAAVPGRLMVGKLEPAMRPERLEYQLVPDSADVVPPGELLEVVAPNLERVKEPRDLVNEDAPVVLDHPPTAMVFVALGDSVYGPLRTDERPGTKKSQWTGGLVKTGPDRPVYRIPAADLLNKDKLGPYHRELTAAIVYDRSDPSIATNKHTCEYRVLMGAALKKLQDLAYPTVSMDSDTELIIRYAKRFRTRKEIQRLRELLQVVEPIIDAEDAAAPGEAETRAFESIRRRVGKVDDALLDMSRSLIESGLIEDKVKEAIGLGVQEHITRQAETLAADIAAKVADLRKENEDLQRRKDSLEGEIATSLRNADDEIERRLAVADDLEREARRGIEAERLALEQKRQEVNQGLEGVIREFREERESIVAQYTLLAPYIKRGDSEATAPAGGNGATAQAAALEFPSFVTGISDDGVTLSELEFFERFERHVKQCGFSYRRADLASFHLAVKCGDITILGGLSGTGKSSLPGLYNDALIGSAVADSSARHLFVGVSPAWMDMRDLIGHVNSLDRRFEPSESGLYRHVIYAQQEWNRRKYDSGIYLVTLDEMNLAHVEHYFSGFLQALEQTRRVPCFDPGSVSPDSPFVRYHEVYVPQSMRFVGTVNFDETTRQLSLRVLDRANLIKLRSSDQGSGSPAPVDQRPAVVGPPVRARHFRDWRRSAPPGREVAEVWDEIQKHLAKLGAPITPRRRAAVHEFLASAPPEMLKPHEAFDMQICQRFLPQVRGLYRPGAQDALDELERVLRKSDRFPESAQAIGEIRQLEQVGAEPGGF
jgi:hypothetical protein